MDRNAIQFFKDHGEKKVRAVLRGDLAGAQFYEPNTKKYLQSYLGVLFEDLWEENRYTKLIGCIDTQKTIYLDDLKKLLTDFDYIQSLGGADAGQAIIFGFKLHIQNIEDALRSFHDVQAIQQE